MNFSLAISGNTSACSRAVPRRRSASRPYRPRSASRVGVLGAAGSDSKHGWLRALVRGYVEAIRNTPFIVQLFFVFFGLPALGVHLSTNTAAILAMT